MIALSCNQMQVDDLQGRWSYLPNNSSAPTFTEFIVKNDTVQLIATSD